MATQPMRIKVSENGPYLVEGGVPLGKQIIGTNDEGESVQWIEGESLARFDRTAEGGAIRLLLMALVACALALVLAALIGERGGGSSQEQGQQCNDQLWAAVEHGALIGLHSGNIACL